MENEEYNKLRRTAPFLLWAGKGKYKNLSGCIIDFISVKKSIKPIITGLIFYKKRLNLFKNFCKKEGLIFEYKKHNVESENKCNNAIDKEKEMEHYTFFISKKKEIIDNLESMVDHGFVLKKEFNSKDFGKVLGYPSCCLEAYDKKELIYDLKPYVCNKIPFYNNVLLTGTGSNCRLFSHMVCSFNCQKTIDLSKRLLKEIKKEVPGYYNFLMKYLKKPLLFWINGRQGHFGLADSLTVFVFDGELKGKELNYKKVYVNFPVNKSVKLVNTPSVKEIEDFLKGNRIIINKKDIKIYKNKKLLSKVERGKKSGILVQPI